MPKSDQRVEGIVEMMLDATQNFEGELSKERLFSWHTLLFSAEERVLQKIAVGTLRGDEVGPMQVVSEVMGRKEVHFEAPPASKLDEELDEFLKWVNDGSERFGAGDLDPVIKAAIGHLWFVTLHPFDDGNGRIARAVADMLLARADGVKERFYSMSSQIRTHRKSYYEILESTQKSGLDITDWLIWFLGCLESAILDADALLENVVAKSRLWEFIRAQLVSTGQAGELSARQVAVLNRILSGFEGNITTSKWAKLGKCSQDTAYRDILHLVELGVLVKAESGGRSTHYEIVWRK